MARRFLFSAFFAAALASVAPGCTCGPTTIVTSCRLDSECPAGSRCVASACQAPDAGVVTDSGVPDAGPQVCVDADSDGHFAVSPTCAAGDDCDDTSAAVHPGVPELCGDGKDNDCNGQTDEPGCLCRAGERVACYSGPTATRGVGICRGGMATCGADGGISGCLGEVVPAATELCNGLDDNCDGAVDEGLRNACGQCSATTPVEVCGDGIDNDCDGLVDEDCNCDFQCQCAPATSCTCAPPKNQPCYTGAFGTGGRGICHGGHRDCVDTGGGVLRWGVCTGQVTPGVECAGGTANSLDDDCDGMVDEGCRDADGDGVPWPADCDDQNAAIHPGAPEVCNGIDDNCNGAVDEGVTTICGSCVAPAATDACGNGLDDDCNGIIDDGCACVAGAVQSCYGGPRGVAGCQAGTQTCLGGELASWGPCVGQVLPSIETCNGVDDDCDGQIDERWAAGSNACGYCSSVEVCDGKDNDCNGLIDDGVSNSCGTCGPQPVETCNGIDDDCDGLVDEGLVNACGLCPPLPCFTETWPTPWSDCTANPASCNGLEQAPGAPGAITLGQRTFNGNRIYIGVQTVNEVAALDTDTGALLWSKPSFGRDPSRTTVAFDGTVWVGNRGINTGSCANPDDSNVVHLDMNGDFVCRADVTGCVRGVAIDAEGDVWAGTWSDGRICRISGSVVTGTGTAARCQVTNCWSVLSTIGGAGEGIYGLAIDGTQHVWTSSVPNTVRFDIASSTFQGFANSARYGIAPDTAGNIWFGDWTNSTIGIHALKPDGTVHLAGSPAQVVTAVTFHPTHGTTWGTRHSDQELVSIWADPVKAAAAGHTVGQEHCRVNITTSGGQGTNPHGVAVDRLGRLWVPMRFGGGWVNVYDTSCVRQATYRVDVRGNELYSYSDMTGAILRTITANEGRWVQDFDSGYLHANWYRVTWAGTTPAGTGVRVIVRSADTQAGLTSAAACGGAALFNSSPADISGCAGLGLHRWLRVEVVLSSTIPGVRPTVSNVDAAWAY
jgi:sugar lactone lactonase YvrE